MPGKVLRVGILTPVRTLDPRESRETVSTTAAVQVYESGCRAPRGEGPAEPWLLEGLTADTPSQWSCRVRAGVVFSDGTPLTAALAASALDRCTVVRAQGRVEVQGERVLFKLDKPNPRFDLTLTLHQAAIVMEKDGQLLGTGPFVPAPGASLDKLRLLRNPRYRMPAAIDEIAFEVYPPTPDGKPQALLEAVSRGAVDFTSMLSRTDAAAVSGMRKLFQPANSTAILFFNTERPALQNPKVRLALAQAVNRMALAEISYTNALAFVASGLLPPMMGAFRDDAGFDLTRAKATLDKAGAKPSRLELVSIWAPRPYIPNPRPVADLLAKQIGALGIEVAVNAPADSETFYRLMMRGEYDMVLAGWIADTPDPADFLDSVLRSDRIQTEMKTSVPCANRSRLRSPEIDAALSAFRADPSPARRTAVLELVQAQMPLLPLMYGPTVAISSWKLKGVDVSPLGVPHFADADLEA